MALYAYRAARADGRTYSGELEADTEVSARAQLEGRGLLVFRLRQQGMGSSLSLASALALGGLGRLPPHQFLVFNQELLALIRAGLPVLKVWDLLIERAHVAGFQDALRAVRQDIRGGAAASDALSRHPRYFPELYVATFRAGEQAGNLPEVLHRYIGYLKTMIALRQKVWKALTYPSFLIVVGLSVVGFLVAYVMPTFVSVYADQARHLPAATQFLLSVINRIDLVLGPVLILATAAVIAGRLWYRTPAGRLTVDRWLVRLPVIGGIVMRNCTVQLTRTLSTVLGGGTPLVEALNVSRSAVSNRHMAEGFRHVVEQIREGTSLGAALRSPVVMPALAIEMLAVGEETGSLETMLKDVAEFFESELDLQLTQLTTWIEPMLLLFMGVLVGSIVIVMYLPVFQLAGNLQ
ncbi:type II secretion system protein [Nitrospira sp.]|nr:type II secretion system protein [Nitrospira sp.]